MVQTIHGIVAKQAKHLDTQGEWSAKLKDSVCKKKREREVQSEEWCKQIMEQQQNEDNWDVRAFLRI